MKHTQRGMTMLVVLVLMSVMLLGGLSLARMTAVGTLAAGNASYREGSLQTSEVGLNTAFAAVRALGNEEVDLGTWYRATPQAVDANGVPVMNFDAAASVTVGPYTANYVAERMCVGAMPVADQLRQCLVKQAPAPGGESRSMSSEPPPPPNSRQFRVTVRVTGPKGTEAWVQSLVTKGTI